MDPKQTPPGRLQHQRYQEAFRIINTYGGRHNHCSDSRVNLVPKQKINPFKLHCYYLDFNGKTLSPSIHNFEINPYKGEKEISSLEIYPWTYLNNAIQKRDTLRRRGKQFRDFITFKYRLYKGPTLVLLLIGIPCLEALFLYTPRISRAR